jgi:hypothetical protein
VHVVGIKCRVSDRTEVSGYEFDFLNFLRNPSVYSELPMCKSVGSGSTISKLQGSRHRRMRNSCMVISARFSKYFLAGAEPVDVRKPS